MTESLIPREGRAVRDKEYTDVAEMVRDAGDDKLADELADEICRLSRRLTERSSGCICEGLVAK